MKAAVYRDDVLELLAAHGLAVMQDGRLGLDERAMVLKRLEPVVEAVSALPTLQPGAGEVEALREQLAGAEEEIAALSRMNRELDAALADFERRP